MGFLPQALVFLAAAVIAVPLSKRLGLGAVLGYLAAGVVIGPSVAGLIPEVENVLHFAEFGVVLLLFVIGLELQPSRLWEMRRTAFGLGSLQVVGTGLLFGGAALALGLSLPAAIIIGFGLALSSTAFSLQLLSEKNQLATPQGQASFGILLFQDLAVIPLLATLPLLAGRAGGAMGAHEPLWLAALRIVGVLLGIVVGGRLLLRPIFRIVAKTQSQEVSTATALLIVVGTALLVSSVGLSMALGAFLAGVLMAESEYRHEIEADIEPFKGLLLGLFFIAVGMSVNVALLLERPLPIVAMVLGLVGVKALVLFVLGRIAFKENLPALDMAVVISQGGEFAFVLFSLAVGFRILDRSTAELLILVVILSMAITPLLYALHARFIRPRLRQREIRPYDVAVEQDNPVIIAGFGRVGQVVGRVLSARRIGFTALDSSPEHIDFLKRFGNRIFYGDASRLDLLRAARADRARVFVLAIDDIEASVRTARTVLEHFPDLTIFARARNRYHAYRLLELGIQNLMRETWVSTLEMTEDVLQELGMPYSEAHSTLERFRAVDEKMLTDSVKHYKDLDKLMEIAASARQELERLFEQDVRP